MEAFCPLDGSRRIAASALDPADPLIGCLVAGRYSIERRLGQGGMGAVYLANQALVDRQVVVKVVRTDSAFNDGTRARFLREARAASRVTHPNIITIFDFGYTDDGMAYLVMELVDGPSLNDVLALEQRLPWRRAARVVAQAARALHAAHLAGIVHRDVKPANVMLARGVDGQDIVKVLDFGLARVLASNTGDKRLTRTGAVIGTPAYMAPEQAAGREAGPAADIYSLGAMLFDLVAGDVPFTSNNMNDLLAQHLNAAPPTMSSVTGDLVVPDALEALVAKCLAKKPQDRPATAAAVADALEQLVAEGREHDAPTPGATRRPFDDAALAATDPGMSATAATAPGFGTHKTEAAPAQPGVLAPPAPVAAPHGAAELSATSLPIGSPAAKPRPNVLRLVMVAWGALVAGAIAVIALRSGGEEAPVKPPTVGLASDDVVAHDTPDATLADIQPAGVDASPLEATQVAPLPPIPRPRGLRLDGMPVD